MTEEEITGYRLELGFVSRALARLPWPVVAYPGTRLYLAVVEGSGVHVPIAERVPVDAFFTVCVVAASAEEEAKRRALKLVRLLWSWSAWSALASGELALRIEEVSVLNERFRWRRFTGRTWFRTRGDGENSAA